MNASPHHGTIQAELLHGTFPSVRIVQGDEHEWTDAHQRSWLSLCSQNPRLHDGGIWSVISASAVEIVIRRDRYKRLAIQDDPSIGDLGVRQLGVKAVTVATDPQGRPCVLIAKRGWRVRTYPSAWETAPAGGIDPRTPLTEAAAADALAAEAREELGIDASASKASVRFVALLQDPFARSVELVAVFPWPVRLQKDWSLPHTREEAWEYTRAQWLTIDQAASLLNASSKDEVTPPARWILSNLRTLLA